MGMIILTSDGIDSKEIYDEFKKVISNRTKVAIITTAKDEKENAKGPKRSSKQFKNMGAEIVDFVDIEFQSPKLLLNYDLIYIEGGNPFRLMHWINKSGCKVVFEKFILENKVLSGRSAGAMVLGKNFSICQYLSPEMNEIGLTDFSGLGLCDINICPHYNAFPTIYERCEEKLIQCEKDNNIKTTKLFDGQALVINDHKINKFKKIEGKVLET